MSPWVGNWGVIGGDWTSTMTGYAAGWRTRYLVVYCRKCRAFDTNRAIAQVEQYLGNSATPTITAQHMTPCERCDAPGTFQVIAPHDVVACLRLGGPEPAEALLEAIGFGPLEPSSDLGIGGGQGPSILYHKGWHGDLK